MISATTWRRVVRPLLPSPDGWAFRGKFAYQTPVDWVGLGVHAEGSGFMRDHVYVSVACCPLFIPLDDLILDHSWRVPNGSSPVGLEDLPATVRLALSELPGQDDALRRIASTATEEAAYARLLLGDVSEAERLLAEPFAPTDDREFVVEARRRRSAVIEALRRGGLDEGLRILRSWRNESATALGLA